MPSVGKVFPLNDLEWEGFRVRLQRYVGVWPGCAEILTGLIRNAGRPCGRAYLASLYKTHEKEGPRERSLAAYVSLLRTHLEELGHPRACIHGEPGFYTITVSAAAEIQAAVLHGCILSRHAAPAGSAGQP